MRFPKHEAGLLLEHNTHRNYYLPLAQWLEEHDIAADDWAAEDQHAKALAEDSCWRLQWYPRSPVGFYVLYAADLEVLLARALEIEAEIEAEQPV